MLATEKPALPNDVLLGMGPYTSVSDTEPRVSALSQALFQFGRNVDVELLGMYADEFVADFDQALSEDSQLSMLPNYCINPSGDEFGDFLVIDLGGSTLRVAIVSISAPSEKEEIRSRVHIVVSNQWTVDNAKKTIDAAFFRWIGCKIKETVESQSVVLALAIITTGITWSFALDSTSYNTANVCHVGKGYVVSKDVVGKDLKQLLEGSVSQHQQMRIDVQSIINDSLAVYAASAFVDNKTKMAMVLGTGLNMCCNLKVSPRIHKNKQLGPESILFNSELSFFGHHLSRDLFTKYDTMIDGRFKANLHFLPHMSTDPETHEIFQPSELLTSGRYLPELVRLAVVDLIENKEMFVQQKKLDLLYTAYDGLTGQLLCLISECDDNAQIAEALAAYYGWNADLICLNDVVRLKLLVDAAIRRAAFVVATCIISFIKLIASHNGGLDTNVVCIGYVGSVMEHFHRYRNLIAKFVNQCPDMVEMGVLVELQLVNESSLVGAAIGAAYNRK